MREVRPGDIGVFPFLLRPAPGNHAGHGEERTNGASVRTPQGRVKANVPDRVALADMLMGKDGSDACTWQMPHYIPVDSGAQYPYRC